VRTKRQRFLNRTITIDPGLHTGVAIWQGDAHPRVFEISLPTQHVCESKERRVVLMADKLHSIVTKYPVEHAFIESVGLWWGKEHYYNHFKLGKCLLVPLKFEYSGSVVAARKGHTFFVAYIIGAYLYVLESLGINTILVSPQRWKGNRSKKYIANLIYNVNKCRYSSDHISDAVGIGFAATNQLTTNG